MNIDLPIFERSTVKRAFYYFLVFNVFVCMASIFLVIVSGGDIPGKDFVAKNTWIIIAVLMFSSFAFTAKSKKELKAVLDTAEFREQVLKYESYYKGKLLWNGFSIVVSGLLFVVTEKNLFFYILIIQLLLSLAFFPTKKLIIRELNNPEIIFT